jgi:hypothetical protein
VLAAVALCRASSGKSDEFFSNLLKRMNYFREACHGGDEDESRGSAAD